MTPAEKQSYLITFNKFQQAREREFAPKIFKALNSQVKEAIHYIKAGVRNPTLYISSNAIVNTLRPLYLDAGVTYGAKVRASIIKQKARMPIGFNQRMVDLMNAYFMTDILNTSEGITEVTRELIQNVLSQAVQDGQGIDWIVSQLQNTEVSRMRARMIARTETVTAANQGAIFAAQDTGLTLNKEWLATNDHRTRNTHRYVNGQKIGMDDYFSLTDGVKMAQPGARTQENGLPTPAKDTINCRCTVVFEPIRDRNGRLV